MTKAFYSTLLLFIFSAGAYAETYKLNPKQSKIHFLASGKPGFFKINGEGSFHSASIRMDSGSEPHTIDGRFEVKVNDLDSGIELRNTHMKKYLGMEQHPTLSYTFTKIPVGKSLNETVTAKGKLTLNGVEKEIPVALTLTSGNKELRGKTSFDVDTSEFGIEIPNYLGITVKKTVKVDVEFVTVEEGVQK